MHRPQFQLRDGGRWGLTRLTAPLFSARGGFEHRVGFPVDQLPKRYWVDKRGRRVLVGLSIEETFEFETLDDLAPLDDSGGHIPWPDGVPITSRERRWIELYQKHDAAWKVMLAKHFARRK